MIDPPRPTPQASGHVGPAASSPIVLSPRDFWWLTFAVWLGGIFILTLLPYLLLPRVGDVLAIAGSYLVFFLAWQPVQAITQRALGSKVAFIRMIIFVAGAATIAAVLRQALPVLTQ